jgi:redox-sensitive bicupin YhaK (pirin superfamily)
VIREVQRIVDARRHRAHSGIVGQRAIPSPGLDSVDPFFLLEEIGPADAEAARSPSGSEAPHQGGELITVLISGSLEYRHKNGQRGVLEREDLLWSLAGAGINYSEAIPGDIPTRAGAVHGLRFGADLPAHLEQSTPRSLKVPAHQISWLPVPGQTARTRVLAGEAFGVRSVIRTAGSIEAQDWLIDSGADVTIPLPEGYQALVYVCHETTWVGDEGLGVRPGQLALLADGQAVRLRSLASTLQPARVLLLAGSPVRRARRRGRGAGQP